MGRRMCLSPRRAGWVALVTRSRGALDLWTGRIEKLEACLVQTLTSQLGRLRSRRAGTCLGTRSHSAIELQAFSKTTLWDGRLCPSPALRGPLPTDSCGLH